MITLFPRLSHTVSNEKLGVGLGQGYTIITSGMRWEWYGNEIFWHSAGIVMRNQILFGYLVCSIVAAFLYLCL